jgi:hypothetical protein
MRYLLLTYYTKPSGKIDEVMTVAKRLKPKDWQIANVILDFSDQKVLACSVAGLTGTRDWDTVVSYYYQHYAATIERLFEENGHHLKNTSADVSSTD